MTSKEALEAVKKHLIEEVWKPIEEDLEILEIIKNKLDQLENIEKALGIDLITLFKASKDGFWTITGKHYTNKKDNNGLETNIVFRPMTYDNEIIAIVGKNERGETDYWIEYSLTDYGKTWALTKEELENE